MRIRLGRAAAERRDVAIHTWQRHAPSTLQPLGLCSQETFELSHNICTRGTLFLNESPTDHGHASGFSCSPFQHMPLLDCNGGIPAWGGFRGPHPWLAAPSCGTRQMLGKVPGGPELQNGQDPANWRQPGAAQSGSSS